MADRKMVNPRVLLIVGGMVLVVASAIAIFLAVSYTPQTSTTRLPSPTAGTQLPSPTVGTQLPSPTATTQLPSPTAAVP